MTGSVVIASREAAKQSSRGRPSHWVASLGNVPLARNDGERCHCESRSGEAIQPGKALALDCFARQCAARSQ
ncbi:MAG: hypothetical protein LBT00_06500 [Spirochaetaceae bacterium]|nr:hypothetical protein [Spirochaetaceae bacterium]